MEFKKFTKKDEKKDPLQEKLNGIIETIQRNNPNIRFKIEHNKVVIELPLEIKVKTVIELDENFTPTSHTYYRSNHDREICEIIPYKKNKNIQDLLKTLIDIYNKPEDAESNLIRLAKKGK